MGKDLDFRYQNRYQALIEISKAVVSSLEDKKHLFKIIADQIRKILPNERVGATLHDPSDDKFRIHLLDTTVPPLYLPMNKEIPHRGSVTAWVIDHQQYHIRPDLARERPFFEDELYFKEGFRSVLNIPLVAKAKIFGTLNIVTKEPADYQDDEIEFLHQVADYLAIAIDNANAYETIKKLRNQLSEENVYLREEIKSGYNFEEIVGSRDVIKKIFRRIDDVAGTDALVLVTGETGTGKELIARAVHHRSKRKERPLIKVDCSALSAGLIESELFGHEKGAFTGAISKRIGRFELANRGTIFLDEIGDLSPEVQTKFLRVIQENEFERIGGTQTHKVDIRVIAATNRNLDQAVAQNNFRADLYYRLNVFPIFLPPLRERKEDIPLLARFFVNKYMVKFGKRIEEISREIIDRLIEYSWPGNIRELENIIERAVILSKGRSLEIGNENLFLLTRAEPEEKRLLSLEKIERDHILNILQKTRWVVEGPHGASKSLGLNPSTLRSRMLKLGINKLRHDISQKPRNIEEGV